MSDKDEERIDRRAHWIQLLVTGLVGATVFCVKLQMNLQQIESDFTQYKKDLKQTLKEYDNRIDDMHDCILLDTHKACGR